MIEWCKICTKTLLYQNMRYNSKQSNPNLLPIGEMFGFAVFLKDVK